MFLLPLLCDCPEIQNDHEFKIGDRVYSNGMIEVFNFGGGPNSGYFWSRCANHYRRIPSKKDLQRYAAVERRRRIRKGISYREETPQIEWTLDWIYGGYFFLGRHERDKIEELRYAGINNSRTIAIHKKGKAFGFDRLPFPPITYFYSWIPSQEQIQNMLKRKLDVPSHNVRQLFYEWYNSENGKTKQHWTDRELWICFYMFTLHSKEFKYGKWQKIK